MRGELVAIVSIAGRESDHRLAALLNLVELFAEGGDGRLAAAKEPSRSRAMALTPSSSFARRVPQRGP
jgi:hypothetical protein